MNALPQLLFVLGVGFLVADVRLFLQFLHFRRLRPSALLTWPGRRPPFYGLLLVLGATLSVLIVYKLVVLRMRPVDVFGETMMLVYYGYAVPLSLKIGRGFYEDGIWADAGFIPYSRIGGLSWREGPGRVGYARAHLPDARIRAATGGSARPLRRRPAAASRQDRRARDPLHRQAARSRHARRTRRRSVISEHHRFSEHVDGRIRRTHELVDE